MTMDKEYNSNHGQQRGRDDIQREGGTDNMS